MESNVEIANGFMDALRKSEFDRLFSYLSENVKIVGASGASYGKQELKQYFSHYENPYRDVKIEHVGTYTFENTVVIEAVLNAVQVKKYMGVHPANKPFEMPTLNVFEVEDEKITAWRQYQNTKILLDLSTT